MNDILLNLVVLSGAVLVVGAILILVRRNQKQKEEIIALLAKQKGWKLKTIREPLAKGFQISAPYWTLEAISRSSGRESGPGSTDIEQTTTWTASQPGTTLLVGPKTSQIDLGAQFEMLMKQVIFSALGEDARGVNQVQTGSSAFQKRFMVWAEDIDAAEKLLTPTVQSALLNWEGVLPMIKRTREGITIELKGVHLHKPDDLTALVHLGEVLL